MVSLETWLVRQGGCFSHMDVGIKGLNQSRNAFEEMNSGEVFSVASRVRRRKQVGQPSAVRVAGRTERREPVIDDLTPAFAQRVEQLYSDQRTFWTR
jgi:hypothetical protein